MSDRERRTKERIREVLNGQWDRLDPTVRQSIVIIADTIDGIHDELREDRKTVDGLRRTVLWVGTTIAGALLSVTGSLLLSLANS